MKILGKSDNNPDHLDIGVGRDIGDEGKRDVARIFSGMGQCDEFDQHVIVGVFLFSGSASKKVTAALATEPPAGVGDGLRFLCTR
ncbi:MAG: hypothetical protein WBQ29_22155 [Isosphaeraceae bacterium]